MIPDEAFDQLFAKLSSHRDRALVAFYVSAGVRASELLGTTVADADPGRQLITVTRKGTLALHRCQPHPTPSSGSASTRPGLKATCRPVPTSRCGGRRGARAALSATTPRGRFNRANAALGANWSLHDLRHTAAYRMARDPGVPLTDIQWVLGHAHLSTTERYLSPSSATSSRRCSPFTQGPERPAGPAPGYRAESLEALFGKAPK